MASRSYIPYSERLAAALSMLLPQEQRDDLRARKVPAQTVISLFQQDHNILHALGGPDLWWNLTPRLVAPHREKSRRDTSIVAKVVRNRDKIAEFNAKIAAKGKPRRQPTRPAWPTRKLQSRNDLRKRKGRRS